jgi:hypothetical protein
LRVVILSEAKDLLFAERSERSAVPRFTIDMELICEELGWQPPFL